MVRGKEKFLVRWKGYMAEEDTWKNREYKRGGRRI